MTPETAAYVKHVVAQAPPFTPEQRAKLAELLRPVRRTARQSGRAA